MDLLIGLWEVYTPLLNSQETLINVFPTFLSHFMIVMVYKLAKEQIVWEMYILKKNLVA